MGNGNSIQTWFRPDSYLVPTQFLASMVCSKFHHRICIAMRVEGEGFTVYITNKSVDTGEQTFEIHYF